MGFPVDGSPPPSRSRFSCRWSTNRHPLDGCEVGAGGGDQVRENAAQESPLLHERNSNAGPNSVPMEPSARQVGRNWRRLRRSHQHAAGNAHRRPGHEHGHRHHPHRCMPPQSPRAVRAGRLLRSGPFRRGQHSQRLPQGVLQTWGVQASGGRHTLRMPAVTSSGLVVRLRCTSAWSAKDTTPMLNHGRSDMRRASTALASSSFKTPSSASSRPTHPHQYDLQGSRHRRTRCRQAHRDMRFPAPDSRLAGLTSRCELRSHGHGGRFPRGAGIVPGSPVTATTTAASKPEANPDRTSPAWHHGPCCRARGSWVGQRSGVGVVGGSVVGGASVVSVTAGGRATPRSSRGMRRITFGRFRRRLRGGGSHSVRRRWRRRRDGRRTGRRAPRRGPGCRRECGMRPCRRFTGDRGVGTSVAVATARPPGNRATPRSRLRSACSVCSAPRVVGRKSGGTEAAEPAQHVSGIASFQREPDGRSRASSAASADRTAAS